jgi:hypothetical protein
MRNYMKWLSTITLDLKIDEICEILNDVCNHRGIVMIDNNITINGPELIDIERVKKSFHEADVSKRIFRLWNTNIELPLCWELFLLSYTEKCEAIIYKTPLKARYEYNLEEYEKITKQKIIEFRKVEINNLFFHSGWLSNSISPIIEFRIPYENKRDYFSLTAEWEKFSIGMWILWDLENRCWKHEYRKEMINVMFGDSTYRKPESFINWQEEIIGTIKNKWSKYIIERHTYQLGNQTDKEVINDSVQRLADLLGNSVVGKEPRPPTTSKRNN